MISILQRSTAPLLKVLFVGLAVWSAISCSPFGKSSDEVGNPQARMDFMESVVRHLSTWALKAGGVEKLSNREDANFVYYEITVKDPKNTTIEARVDDRQITIKGKVSKNNGASTSNFSSSFPAPEDVDTMKMEMLNEQGKFVLKFPKIKEPSGI